MGSSFLGLHKVISSAYSTRLSATRLPVCAWHFLPLAQLIPILQNSVAMSRPQRSLPCCLSFPGSHLTAPSFLWSFLAAQQLLSSVFVLIAPSSLPTVVPAAYHIIGQSHMDAFLESSESSTETTRSYFPETWIWDLVIVE